MKKIALYLLGLALMLPRIVWAAPAVVSEKDLHEALASEFVNQGVDEAVDIEIFGGQTNFVYEDADTAKVMISLLKYDALQNKFTADVEIFADGQSKDKTVLMGKYYPLQEVWVPKVNITKGELLTAKQFKTVSIRASRVKPMHIIDLEKLVGKEAKRSLKEGRLVTDRDVGNKIIIKKGDIVSLLYRTEHMQITAKAEAQRDAAKGDKIEVMNIKSRKILFGTVLDKDTVSVDVQ